MLVLLVVPNASTRKKMLLTKTIASLFLLGSVHTMAFPLLNLDNHQGSTYMDQLKSGPKVE